jgi:RHS repeat-associated protein
MSARLRLRRRLPLAAVLLALLGLPQVAAAQTEAVDYYGVDALGSIRVVFRPDGTVIGRADYAPFGEATGDTSGSLPPGQYTGQERDPEAAQDYFHARYYQPRHGRFGSVDQIFGNLFDPQQLNRYAYAKNSPLVFVDPTGLLADGCTDTFWDSTSMSWRIQCGTAGGGGGGGGGGGMSLSMAFFLMTGGSSIGWGSSGGAGGEPSPKGMGRAIGGTGQGATTTAATPTTTPQNTPAAPSVAGATPAEAKTIIAAKEQFRWQLLTRPSCGPIFGGALKDDID